MKLYEITERLATLQEMAEEEEVCDGVIADTLEGLEGEFEDKLEAYGKVMRQLEVEADAYENEAKAVANRLNQQAQLLRKNVERMKAAIENAMRATGKVKVKTKLFDFAIRKNPPALQMVPGTVPPFEFLIDQEPKIDKKGIIAALKEGRTIEGCSLVQKESLRISMGKEKKDE